MIHENASPQSSGFAAHLFQVARLVRLPNVMTLISNVLAAQLVFSGSWNWTLLFVLPMSIAFYFAGMVGNDVNDFEHDRATRSDRVLPSGQLTLEFAVRLRWLFNVLGLAIAILFSALIGSIYPLALAFVLLAAIEVYNRWAKRYWFGALVMGFCRTANLYLVASHWIFVMAANASNEWQHIYAWSMGLYVCGITGFARNEEKVSVRWSLILAAFIAALGIVGIGIGISAINHPNAPAADWFTISILFVLILLPLIRTAARAMIDPSSRNVQRAIGVGLRSIITLDAFVCLLVASDQRWMAIFVACLLVPSYLLSRKIPQT